MPAPSTSAIRTWAQNNGHPVGDRGRLPTDVVAAYEKAHRKSKPAAPAAAPIMPVTKQPVEPTVSPRTSPTPAPPVVDTPDPVAERLAAVEKRLAEVTRRLETLEAAPPRRLLRRRG